MKKYSLFTMRRLAVVLAVAGIGAFLGLGGWYWGRAQTISQVASPLRAYSDTLALVRFQIDRSVVPERSLHGPCGPIEVELQDEKGALLARFGTQEPGSAFMSCEMDEQGVSHYTLIFLGDFRVRPPHQVHLRFASSDTDAATARTWKGFEKATWEAIVGVTRQGISFEDALQTSEAILLRLCAQLPSIEDWHPRGELIFQGEVWEIAASGIPNFRKPGVLGTTHRCYIALLEKSPQTASALESMSGVQFHLHWERSLPECFSARTYQHDIAPFLKERDLSPEQVGLTPQQDAWCLGSQLHPALWTFLQEEWRMGPAYTLQITP